MMTPQTESLLADLVTRLQHILPESSAHVLAKIAFTEAQKWKVTLSEEEVEAFVHRRTGR
jgi:hypothetical protein